jgi:flagellar protein FliL
MSEVEGGNPKKRLIVIVGVLALALTVQIVIGVFIVKAMMPEDPALKAIEDSRQQLQRERAELTSMGLTLEAPIEVIVNIAHTNGERYLKVGVQLEWDPRFQNLGNVLAQRNARIRDIVIGILSSKTLEELQSAEGKVNIRNAIVADINNILPDEEAGRRVGNIRSCYFVEFIIQ